MPFVSGHQEREANHETSVRQISSGEADPVQSLHHPRHREYHTVHLPSPQLPDPPAAL